jgi:hypothetical protein
MMIQIVLILTIIQKSEKKSKKLDEFLQHMEKRKNNRKLIKVTWWYKKHDTKSEEFEPLSVSKSTKLEQLYRETKSGHKYGYFHHVCGFSSVNLRFQDYRGFSAFSEDRRERFVLKRTKEPYVAE